jgi:hypothetical protein
MQKRVVAALLGLCATLSLAADQNQPVFYFGGKRLFVGMAKTEAVASLSACCKLSPSADSEADKLSADTGQMIGHFILTKEESSQRILGNIFFAGGKVVRITRPLDGEKFDPESGDVVAFARALNRAFSFTESKNSNTTIIVSVRHSRVMNAISEILTLSLSNGRSVELQIVTLDIPSKFSGKRDSISLDEVLEPPSR